MTARPKKRTVAEQRKYAVLDVEHARKHAAAWLLKARLVEEAAFGLPEIDDRYHIWRVPIVQASTRIRIGECVINARTAHVSDARSTSPSILAARLSSPPRATVRRATAGKPPPPVAPDRANRICAGDCATVLQGLEAESVHLVFTSPPYYNARPEYTDYTTYEQYLSKMRTVIRRSHRVLAEGRFFVINVSPVLIRRTSRGRSSRRLAVPFDFHRIFVEEGFDFIDDIIWMKPEGAGWATGRGRRFAADRNPLQYKAVPITEYVLVYRKHTERLIDWDIRHHPDQALVARSKIADGYERTNVWKIKPAHRRDHPAVFPIALAERVVSYYSFKGDVVLDPFAGVGTVGAAAAKLGRRFVLIEQNQKYVDVMRREIAGFTPAF